MAKLNKSARLMVGTAALALSCCTLAVASEGPVQQGEAIQLHYVCRIANGELAAATYRDESLDKNLKRSSIYLPLKNDAPEKVIAGPLPPSGPQAGPFDFADAILAELAEAAVGLIPGQKRPVAISAQTLPNRSDNIIQLARVRRRPKEMRMTPDEYQQRTGKTPEVGQELTFDPAVPGHVVSVSATEVAVRFKATVGESIETPFGPALVKADEHSYLLEIAAQKGALVRSGSMVGRIVEVRENVIIIDYRHPLAGEDLQCEMSVERPAAPAPEEQNL